MVKRLVYLQFLYTILKELEVNFKKIDYLKTIRASNAQFSSCWLDHNKISYHLILTSDFYFTISQFMSTLLCAQLSFVVLLAQRS